MDLEPEPPRAIGVEPALTPVEVRRENILGIETLMRAAIAVFLVVGLLGLIAYGMWRPLKPADVAQYVSPVSGLAGLAVGYFFGRAPSR